MLPPLLKILLHEPALLVSHAAGYAALIQQETTGWRDRFKRRIGGYILLGVSGFLTVLFSGVAVMLYAVTGTAHWLLWAVPALSLAVVVLSVAYLSTGHSDSSPFPRVQAQFDKDLQAFGLKHAESQDPEQNNEQTIR